MRILFNLLGYTTGGGGVETYLLNLLRALQNIDAQNDYWVLCDPVASARLSVSRPNFKLQQLRIEKPSSKWFIRGVFKCLSGYDILNWQLKDLAVDIIHHPLTTLNPSGLPHPAVLTFHDLQHEFFPQHFTKAELNKRRREYFFSVHKARAVIAISQHVKDCLIDRYDVPVEKIHVVYHGYSGRFKMVENKENLSAIAAKYSLARPFMIYPAATWSHKNHLRLLGAVKVMVDRGRFNGELLLTGASMGFHSQVVGEIDRLGLEGVVRWLGCVPGEDLPSLYNLARMMVFPSLFEGFGLPVIEAMACGCPAAISNTTALPEIAGGAAALFDAESIEDIAETIGQVWEDETLRDTLLRSGLERVCEFSWEKSALETVEVYRNVYNECPC